MTLHPEVLSARQARVLHSLAPCITALGFYLGGGTALALYLAHRRSLDFDWFTERRIPGPLRLSQELRDAGIPVAPTHVEPGTLYGSIAGVRVTSSMR